MNGSLDLHLLDLATLAVWIPASHSESDRGLMQPWFGLDEATVCPRLRYYTEAVGGVRFGMSRVL